jgi:drug/metabolite transporter (DMT)-like permease
VTSLGFFGATVAGGVLGPVALMYGLSLSQVSAASLALNMEAVLTAGIAWVVFREHFDHRIFLGMCLIVLGGVVLTFDRSAGMNFGLVLVVLACLFWGIDNNLTRKVSHGDVLVLTAIKSLVAGATNLGIASFVQWSNPSGPDFVKAGLVGFLGYGLSICFFILSLRKLGTARTGAVFSTAPFVGALISVFLLSEPLSPQLAVAALLMGIGVWLHLTESHSHDHTHEEMEHSHSHTHDEHHQHKHMAEDPPGEPHTHKHRHEKLTHSHRHFPDLHHRHSH